jgi:hypothetical protein
MMPVVIVDVAVDVVLDVAVVGDLLLLFLEGVVVVASLT